MAQRDSILFWSIPVGNWFRTNIRVSVFFPVVLAVMWYKFGLRLGGAFTGVLFVSVLLHEFGHIFGARRTGGTGSDILIWPLGGLASVSPAHRFGSQFFTAAAGPLVNLWLCLISAYWVVGSPWQSSALNPLYLPGVELRASWPSDLMILAFSANWMLLLANLIPVHPLDGGRMLKSFLVHRQGKEVGGDVYARIGTFVACVIMTVGLFVSNEWVVAVGAIVLILNFYDAQQTRVAESYDESFLGYDFSQGYTSLERGGEGEPEAPKQPRKSWLQRWREKRQEVKNQKRREEEAKAELLLDELLDKVHAHGMNSLTEEEKRALTRASALLKNRQKSSQANGGET